ncbi:hypothetical protein GCM10029992_09830 [Glycomyces albus]
MSGQTAPELPEAAVTVDVPAKINPHLGVGDARPDGYHSLATVYQSISLYDTVTVSRRREPGSRSRSPAKGPTRSRPTRRTWPPRPRS